MPSEPERGAQEVLAGAHVLTYDKCQLLDGVFLKGAPQEWNPEFADPQVTACQHISGFPALGGGRFPGSAL